MADVRYFSGEVRLTYIHSIRNAEFEAAFPGVNGRRSDSYSKFVGAPADEKPEFVQDRGWVRTILPVDRVVTFKRSPSLHECDARCMNATGRTMNCECSCSGANHGRGSLACT